FEMVENGVFNVTRYFDVVVEYVTAAPEDILIRITAHNRGPAPARVHLLPTIWFRNTWSWNKGRTKPVVKRVDALGKITTLALENTEAGRLWLACSDAAETLFTENETNTQRLYAHPGPAYAKDGIND